MDSNTTTLGLKIKTAALTALDRAELILQHRWTASTHSLTAQGYPCHHSDPLCARTNLYGALMQATATLKATPDDLIKIEQAILLAVRASLPPPYVGRGIVTFNLSCNSVEPVLDVVRRAKQEIAR